MTRENRGSKPEASNSLRNVLAAMLTCGVVAGMYYSYQPASADDLPPVEDRISRLDSKVLVTPSVPSLQDVVPTPQDRMEAADEAPKLNADQLALKKAIDMLHVGVDRLDNVDNYSFVFDRQERIDGELRENQQIQVKLRHAPFSVYMQWLTGDRGRELLYTENQNENRMLVKLGGLKGRFIPTLKLDPNGDQAKSESRHPITQAGLVNLAREIIKNRRNDLEAAQTPRCVVEEGHSFNDRPCTRLFLEYASKEQSPVYRKTITLIDDELSLPVYVRNYTWPNENMVDIEQETLIECYAFSEIQFERQLADATWERENPDYRFR
ncbi:DUF1571 domain-containing protein [Rubinisphaera margarita]|uniref:DUF1571 domain-containing protein n=1 Tax=Rubinisphaera margarita TaxID=2909586 RepID=UPI001EE93599|nr:DUF1571 domain-containing protein [Rubinisphaera margarita]MCG6155575.1 DUF1571 domain-containing protein [Rubinisphaera margarita]